MSNKAANAAPAMGRGTKGFSWFFHAVAAGAFRQEATGLLTTPFFQPSGPATGSCNGLHPKKQFPCSHRARRFGAGRVFFDKPWRPAQHHDPGGSPRNKRNEKNPFPDTFEGL
jgi:hypothetical protein